MTDADASAAAGRPLNAVFAAVWMAIALGLALQLAILAAKLGAGASVPGAQVMVDIAGGVTWSLVVCAGVAIGAVASRSQPMTMGLFGLICAPLAFAAAKGVQRGTQWVAGQPTDKITALVIQTGLVKTIEYALLGFLLGRLIRSARSTLPNHAALGLGVGAVFAAVLYGLNVAHGAPMPPPKTVGLVLNELVFPVGCSMVIYWVARLADSTSALERAIAGGG
jgi:hypothetical protein